MATTTNTAANTVHPSLAALFPPARVRASLRTPEAWSPVPTAAMRGQWDALPRPIRRRLIAEAEEFLDHAWPALPATRFLDFARDGNRSRYEEAHFARRRAVLALAIGECAEGRGRFLDDLTNGVWALCEESFWGVPAHNFSQRPPFAGGHRSPTAFALGLPDTAYRVVDLFAAETGALLAWVHYLLGDALAGVSPVIPDRLAREIMERILVPYRAHDDWWWYGLDPAGHVNNWNPWIHSNVLVANLLIESDAEARAATVDRVLVGLDAFLATYGADGGCDEGPGYWDRAGGSLFDCLSLLADASGGALDAFGLPLIAEIGRYIYRMHVGGPWYVNFADGSAQPQPDGDLLRRYGARIGDDLLVRQGVAALDVSVGVTPPSGVPADMVRVHELDAALFQDPKQIQSATRRLRVLFGEPAPDTDDRAFPFVREAWQPDIQVLTTRETAGSAWGLFLAAKGGHNAESHNHNDVGQFLVAVDGRPVLVDLGVGEYTRQTFGPERYDIFTMQSQYHNLPLVNGVGQAPGREFAARDAVAAITDEAAGLSLDIAGAYPPEAGIERWQRAVRLERATARRAARVVLTEAYTLAETPRSLALHLIAAGAVDTALPGVLVCENRPRPLAVRYDTATFAVTTERVPIDDARLTPVWGDTVTRIILTARQPTAEGNYEITMKIVG